MAMVIDESKLHYTGLAESLLPVSQVLAVSTCIGVNKDSDARSATNTVITVLEPHE
jgi:hypothetical protein